MEKERVFVIVSSRDDFLIPRELVRLLATDSSHCRLYVACPTPCLDGTRNWIETMKIEYTAENVSIEALPFDPYGDRKTCREAAEKFINVLTENNCSTIDSLVLYWQGATPGRYGTVLEESGILEMAQTKILSQLYLIEQAIESKLLASRSRVIVSGSEAARGIPTFGFPVPSFGDSVDSFVSVLNGSSINRKDGPTVYGYMQGCLSLYIATLAKRHPQVYFSILSPGFTQDSLNANIQIAENPMEYGFFKWQFFRIAGIAQDFTVAARNYYNAATGHQKWTYPSGALVAAAKGTTGELLDQSSVEGGAYLADELKQDLAYEALHKFVI